MAEARADVLLDEAEDVTGLKVAKELEVAGNDVEPVALRDPVALSNVKEADELMLVVSGPMGVAVAVLDASPVRLEATLDEQALPDVVWKAVTRAPPVSLARMDEMTHCPSAADEEEAEAESLDCREAQRQKARAVSYANG